MKNFYFQVFSKNLIEEIFETEEKTIYFIKSIFFFDDYGYNEFKDVIEILDKKINKKININIDLKIKELFNNNNLLTKIKVLENIKLKNILFDIIVYIENTDNFGQFNFILNNTNNIKFIGNNITFENIYSYEKNSINNT